VTQPDTDPEQPTKPQSKEGEPPLTLRERIWIWLSKVQFITYTTLVILLLMLGFLWPRMFISIPAGHRAVMYRFFQGGTVTDRIWGEGLHVIPPWDNLTDYETRLQQQEIKFGVLSEEGLDLGILVSVRYRPNKDMLGYLHQDIGPDYFNRLIKPEVEAHVRRTLGSRPAHEVYTSTRDILQELGQIPALGRDEETQSDAKKPVRAYVNIQELKLLDVNLPQVVEAAVAEKYRQEQLMLEYRYKLDREEKEAERRRTEAAGIRDYNLIAGKITPDLLRWRGIDATLELAKSQNTKVVVLGGGQGGVSMLMNVDGAGAPAAEAKALPAPVAAADKAPPAADDKRAVAPASAVLVPAAAAGDDRSVAVAESKAPLAANDPRKSSTKPAPLATP
jgi:regulator of protease activity HflC (stomatin/prohibitin superfamily)